MCVCVSSKKHDLFHPIQTLLGDCLRWLNRRARPRARSYLASSLPARSRRKKVGSASRTRHTHNLKVCDSSHGPITTCLVYLCTHAASICATAIRGLYLYTLPLLYRESHSEDYSTRAINSTVHPPLKIGFHCVLDRECIHCCQTKFISVL